MVMKINAIIPIMAIMTRHIIVFNLADIGVYAKKREKISSEKWSLKYASVKKLWQKQKKIRKIQLKMADFLYIFV